ncbi:hypothetical protein H7698_16500 [Pseudomonas sp. p50]|uniref:hypothetical protein n=1 Tax=Pseudomonas sp. p50(2008) TaxID=2816832 RepID=UPI00188CC96B|nr:hypothetical protein [Pseudomonas sp. p50(2008)]MBF4557679.1 hypothetical protein [Pseudomonas sp. p50(2008)]
MGISFRIAAKKMHSDHFQRPGIQGVFRINSKLNDLMIVDQGCQADEAKMTMLSGWSLSTGKGAQGEKK